MAGLKQRSIAVISWIRAHVTRRRVARTLFATIAFGAVAITAEALLRAHIDPPSARASSALYTRPVAWGDDAERLTPVRIGAINPDLHEQRDPVELRNVPQDLIDAVLAVEDQRFYQHHGLDIKRIAGAFVANVKAGGVSEGGSTITQQLAKNLFLHARRTPLRKVREAALAAVLEIRYRKQQILEAYLNEIYLGQDGPVPIYGVGAASRYYFGKTVNRVSLAESAVLAGMIRSPNRLAPTRHPAAAATRRNLVLSLMAAQQRVEKREADRARTARLSSRSYPLATIDARYFRDYVAASATKNIPDRGVRIYTTLDATLQRSAERALVRGLGRMRPGAQAALVAIDPRSGDVLAMVGGRDYGASQFNRATDARRQPGSAFKPFVALAALEGGSNGKPAFTLASILQDEPITVRTPQGDWEPLDYDGEFRGSVTFRHALEQSLNVPFVRVGLAIGPARIASTARRLGVASTLNAVPSLALGSSEVTLLELVRAYGVLAAQGNIASTRTIVGRGDAEGVQQAEPPATVDRVADPAATFLVTSALQGAVEHGTGAGLGAGRFRGDIAGKTGTSNDWRDAWFVAYSPTIVVGVWVGYDDGRSLQRSGGSAAVPIVADFFTIADATRGESFDVPNGIETSYVASADWGSCGEREYFLAGTAPQFDACGFRGLGDALEELGGRFRRMLLERLRGSTEPRRRMP